MRHRRSGLWLWLAMALLLASPWTSAADAAEMTALSDTWAAGVKEDACCPASEDLNVHEIAFEISSEIPPGIAGIVSGTEEGSASHSDCCPLGCGVACASLCCAGVCLSDAPAALVPDPSWSGVHFESNFIHESDPAEIFHPPGA